MSRVSSSITPATNACHTVEAHRRRSCRASHSFEAPGQLARARFRAPIRFADAVDAAMIAVHAEPLRESAQRALAEVHLAEGNVVEARRALRAYATLLRHEVGVRRPPS